MIPRWLELLVWAAVAGAAVVDEIRAMVRQDRGAD